MRKHMRTYRIISLALTVFVMLNLLSTKANAQAIDPKKSARALATYDEESTAANIASASNLIFFAQLAVERSKNADILELAKEMIPDLSEILFSMEQLEVSAGNKKAGRVNEITQESKKLQDDLSQANGFKFDTTWTSGVLRLQQSFNTDLGAQKEQATNPRLKSAVTSAVPIIKRYTTRINTLQKQIVRVDVQQKKAAAKEEAAHQKAEKQKKRSK